MRYQRQKRLPEIGASGQEKISAARILVTGAGALGCAALQFLASAGVGTIGIIDGDIVELSNLARQILFTENDPGQPKVNAAALRLNEMNSEIIITPLFKWLNDENALDIIRDYDLVLECSDNFQTKLLVNDACVMLEKPCVLGSAIGFMGQISVYNYHGGPTYRCVFPELPDPMLFPSCADVGVMGMVPGVIGTMQALEAIKIITGAGNVLSGKLLQYDGLKGQFTEFEIQPNPENRQINKLTRYELSCPDHLLNRHLIGHDEFLSRLSAPEKNEVIAFSEDDQPVRFQGFAWDTLPLFRLPEITEQADGSKDLVLVCEYGIKSTEALKFLLTKLNFKHAYGLKDGLAALRLP